MGPALPSARYAERHRKSYCVVELHQDFRQREAGVYSLHAAYSDKFLASSGRGVSDLAKLAFAAMPKFGKDGSLLSLAATGTNGGEPAQG